MTLPGQTKDILEEKKIKAREMWLKDTSKKIIADELHVRKQTLYNWAKAGNWDQAKTEIVKKIEVIQESNIAEEKARSLKIIKAAEVRYAKELNASTELPKSTGMFAQLQRVKWEILIPRTVTQNNFIKTENNMTKYTLEIIDPNDNKVESKQKTVSGMEAVTG